MILFCVSHFVKALQAGALPAARTLRAPCPPAAGKFVARRNKQSGSDRFNLLKNPLHCLFSVLTSKPVCATLGAYS